MTLALLWVYEGGFGSLLGHFGVTLGSLWVHSGSGGGSLVDFDENPQRFLVLKGGPGTKSMGAGMHQGCTEDAPRMHQGCTEDAPRMHQGCTKEASRKCLGIVMGPRHPHIQEEI